jgi:N-acetyl-anhydromuramyl-L-alanine amidase AmpD
VGFDRVEQHYPISAYCWHAGDVDDDGGVAANIDLVGIEHLGMAGQPLTAYQIEMTTKITQFCADQYGLRDFARYPTQRDVWTLAEHKEVSDVYTECPSNRIPWSLIIGGLRTEEEEDMALQEELEKLRKDVAAQQEFQNKVLIQHEAAVKFLSKVVVNHEGRIKGLER